MNAQESIWDDARQDAECAKVNRLIAINKLKTKAAELVDLTPGDWKLLFAAGAVVALAFWLTLRGGV